MLVLTRKKDETISIGPNIKVTVVRIKGKSVRIGIEAPETLKVLRGELNQHEQRTAEPQPMSQTADSNQDRSCHAPLREQLHRQKVNGVALSNHARIDSPVTRRAHPVVNGAYRPTESVAGRRIATSLSANG